MLLLFLVSAISLGVLNETYILMGSVHFEARKAREVNDGLV